MRYPALSDDWKNQSIALFDCRITGDRLMANLGYFRMNLADRPYQLTNREGNATYTIRLPKQACRLREDATACVEDLPFEIVE